MVVAAIYCLANPFGIFDSLAEIDASACLGCTLGSWCKGFFSLHRGPILFNIFIIHNYIILDSATYMMSVSVNFAACW